MLRLSAMQVGVLIERRPAASAWCTWSWKACGILPATAEESGPRLKLLREDGGQALFHAGVYRIELHRADTPGYRQNLSMVTPMVYVAARPDGESGEEGALAPYLVTVSPDEALACTEGDDAVYPVAMPGFVASWVAAYVDAHHRDAPLKRHKRKGGGAGAHGSAPGSAAPSVARRGWEAP